MGEPTNDAVEQVMRAFLDCRDQRAALKREFEALDTDLKEAMRQLEVVLLQYLDGIGVDNVTKRGVATAYVEIDSKPICTDWSAFHGFISKTGQFDLLQKRVGEGAVKALADSSGSPPPGIEFVRERVVRVRVSK